MTVIQGTYDRVGYSGGQFTGGHTLYHMRFPSGFWCWAICGRPCSPLMFEDSGHEFTDTAAVALMTMAGKIVQRDMKMDASEYYARYWTPRITTNGATTGSKGE